MKYENYLPKDKLVTGAWYKGFCRNSFMALWDGIQFLIIKQDFVFGLDRILHFDDVKDTGEDGFVPLSVIIDFRGDNYKELGEFKRKIGYK